MYISTCILYTDMKWGARPEPNIIGQFRDDTTACLYADRQSCRHEIVQSILPMALLPSPPLLPVLLEIIGQFRDDGSVVTKLSKFTLPLALLPSPPLLPVLLRRQ